MSTNNETMATTDKPTEGTSSSPLIVHSTYPTTIVKTVTIKPKRTTTVLPESGTLGNSAEMYIQKIGGSYAGHGSALHLGRVVLTRAEEQKWFPAILSISPSHQDWDKYLNAYWNDLSVNIFIDGLILNCNVRYESIDDIGTPENVVHYILYKYCLQYGDVANTVKDVNKSPKIRFYLWTKEEDVQSRLSKQQLIDSSFIARKRIEKTPERYASVIILFGKELPVNDGDRLLLLADLQNNQPAKFLEYAQDDGLLDKAFIQRCINIGLLRRPLHSEMIMYQDKVVGNSLNEAIGWLNQADNTVIKAELQNQLKISR